jgi:hypothetical protein
MYVTQLFDFLCLKIGSGFEMVCVSRGLIFWKFWSSILCIWKQVRGLHEQVQFTDFGFARGGALTSKYGE